MAMTGSYDNFSDVKRDKRSNRTVVPCQNSAAQWSKIMRSMAVPLYHCATADLSISVTKLKLRKDPLDRAGSNEKHKNCMLVIFILAHLHRYFIIIVSHSWRFLWGRVSQCAAMRKINTTPGIFDIFSGYFTQFQGFQMMPSRDVLHNGLISPKFILNYILSTIYVLCLKYKSLKVA